jgi:trans-aconitate methyltransferase
MRDAKSGINEVVEQPALLTLLPPLDDAVVVDLGCGDGQLCRVLVDKGAKSVLGVDPSARMLTLAEKRTVDHRVLYRVAYWRAREATQALELPAAEVSTRLTCPNSRQQTGTSELQLTLQ